MISPSEVRGRLQRWIDVGRKRRKLLVRFLIARANVSRALDEVAGC